MESKPEPKPNPEPQLHLPTLPYLKQQQLHYSGALTPLHTSASVPFSWEQEPGKPLPCLTLTTLHSNDIKSLELPPRLLYEAKTPSPTTVLDGPYSLGRSILGSSSFRFLRKRQKSFDGVLSCGSSPDRSLLNEKKDKGLFGSWRKKGGVDIVDEGGFVVSSFSDDGFGGGDGGGGDEGGGESVEVGSVPRKKLKTGFWATVYATFKQVIHIRSTK